MNKQNKPWISVLMVLFVFSIMAFVPKMLEATIYGKISGRVTKEDTGEGLKDVIVLLHHYYNNRFSDMEKIRTGKDGKFAFDRIPEGRYSLVFLIDWESGYFIHERAEQNIIKENAFNVEKGQHYRIEKKALLGGELRVVVKNSNGTGFICPSDVGFNIQLFGESGMPYGYGPHKNPTRPGEYYLKLPAGTYRCEVQVDGYPTQKAKDIRIEKGKIETREFTVDLNDSTGIEGSVISSEDGSPISEILLVVYDENSNERICKMRSDDKGHYVVVGLTPGKYRIFCTYPYKTFKGIMVTKGKKTWFEIKIEPDQAESTLSISSSGTIAYSGPFFLDELEANASNSNYYKFPPIFQGLFVNGNLVDETNYPEYEDVFFKYLRGAIRKGRGLDGFCLKPQIYHDAFVRNLRNTDYKKFTVNLHESTTFICGQIPYEIETKETIFEINLYILPPFSDEQKKVCGCDPEPTIFHELLHLLILDKLLYAAECALRACEKDCYPNCAPDIPEVVGDESDWRMHERCRGKNEKGEEWRIDCSNKRVPNNPQPPSSDQSARPDNDHGDDNYSSAIPRAVEGVVESLNPEVLVLKRGFWQEAGAYMNKLGKRFSYIEPDQSPLEMKDPPTVLFIPSGGLYGLDKSEQFRTMLKDYVSQGGTVIVLSQQMGYEFKALPGGEEIEAQGWREDISCWWENTFIDWWHPVFSRITDAKISILIDGYFARVPDGSTVLLSKAEGSSGWGHGNPVLFYYSWGEGTVVASSSFEDYAEWISGSPEKRRAVFRDLLTWALAPRVPIPEYNLRENASPTVNLNVEVENRSEEPASSAKIIWLTPNRRVVYEEEKLVSLPAGGKIEIPLSYGLSNIPEADYGIWHVDYVLYSPDDQEIQSPREAATGRFSVCLPSEEFIDAYKLFVEIQPEQMQMLAGTSAKFKVRIVNRAAEAKKLRLYWSWWLIPPATYWEEVEVPPGGYLSREITVNGNQLCVHVFEENGLKPYHSLINAISLASQDPWPYVGSKQGRAIRVVYPLVEASIQAEKSCYRKGEEVKIRSIIRNKIAFSYPVDYEIKVEGRDINGKTKTFFSDRGQVEMEADGETVFEKAFVPAAEAGIGVYFIYFYITHDQWKWFQNKSMFVTDSFHIADSGVIVSPRIPYEFVFGAASDVSFDLKCGGKFPAENGTLTLQLVSAQNEKLFQETKPVSMAVGETKTVAFSVPITGLKFGTNRLEYAYSDETGCQFSGTRPVEYRFYLASASFDKRSYQMGETAQLHIVWNGSGQVESDLGIEVAMPETGYEQTIAVHYAPGSTGGTADVDIPLAANLLSTQHEVLVTCLSPTGQKNTSKRNLVVAQPHITLTPRYDKSFYRIREALSFTLEVEGKSGFIIPLPSQLRLEIPSLNYDTWQAVIVSPAGKLEVPVSLTIPATLAAGSYDVKTTLTLPNGSGVVNQSRYTIRPVIWEITPERLSYTSGETINVILRNAGGVDGTGAYQLSLEGNHGEQLAFKDGSASIQAGGEMSGTLAIPDQAVSGEYSLAMTLIDQDTNKEITQTLFIQIAGLSASLEAKTNKDRYFTSETVTGLSRILAGPRELKDANLELKVTRLKTGIGSQEYTPTNFDGDNGIYALAFDSAGKPIIQNYYFGGESIASRIYKFTGSDWELIGQGDYRSRMFIDSLDRIWAPEYLGVSVYDSSHWIRYTTADGLASNWIRCVAEDSAGNIWLATYKGLSKFDGRNFVNYANPLPQYQHPSAVAVDQDNKVWVAFSSRGGVGKFDGTNWTIYTTENSGLLNNGVSSIAVDKDNHKWFGTYIGLSEYDGSQWRNYTSAETGFDLSGGIGQIVFDRSNILWASYRPMYGSLNSLLRFDGTSWTSYLVSDVLTSHEVNDIDSAPDGTLWVSTCHGIAIYDGAGWKPYYIDKNIDGLVGYPRALVVDSDNIKWIGTDYGLLKFDGDRWTPYLISDNKTVGRIISLALAPDNIIWLATDRGLKRFDRINWTTYPYPESLQENILAIHSIAVDSLGKVWLNGDQLWVFDGADWKSYGTEVGLPEAGISSICVDKQGRIWVGTIDTGVAFYDGQTWTKFDQTSGLSSNEIYSIFADSAGAVWAATIDGLNRYDGQSWKVFTTADGLPGNFIISVAEDKAGTIWALSLNDYGHVNDLARFNGIGWELISFKPTDSGILVVDQDNTIWIICSGSKIIRLGTSFLEENTVWSSRQNVNQAAGSAGEIPFDIGVIQEPGKYILKGALNAATGQEIAASSYAFQLFGDNISLSMGAEKKYYRQAENVVISGEVANETTLDEPALILKIYEKSGEVEETIFEDTFVVPAGASQPFTLSRAADSEGVISLRAEVLKAGSAVATAASGFEVSNPKIEAELITPEFVGNEPFNLNVSLKNGGKIAGSSKLKIESLGFEQSVTLVPSEEKLLLVPAQISQTTTFTVEFSGDLELQLQKTVIYGHAASIEFPASLIYPKGVVTIPLSIRNTGSLDLALEISYELYAATNPTILLASLKRDYSILAQNSFLDSLLFSLAPGEYILKYASTLVQGQVLIGVVDPGAGRLTLQPQSVYAQGLVTMPLTLLNEAPYAGDIDLNFKVLRGQEEVFTALGSYYLSPGEARSDSISFPVEAEGEYTFLVQGAKLAPVPPLAFRVVPLEKLEPVVTFEAPSGGALPLSVQLKNTGYNDFQGFVEARSDFYHSQQAVNVPGGQTQNIDMTLDLASGAAGEHQVSVVLVSAAGQETVLETKPITIEAADIVVSELPSGKSFQAGEQASLTFKLRNQGNLGGEAEFGLKVMDILNETREVVVAPGAEEEVTFSFGIPGDLVGQDYSAFYKLEGSGVRAVKEGDLRFSIQGIAIDVNAQLDKPSYREGETARLTLIVTNRNQTPVELSAKVGYLDYEGEHPFTLETSMTLDFLIPLPQISEGKVFYGIYHRDGRGIHLNDIYIYQKGEGADVELDRQVYEPGSNVLIGITTPKAGLMRISGPGYEEAFAVEGSAGRSFTLPSSLQAGTYFLSWEFTPADGSGPESATEMFDVAGLKVVVTEASLSKGKYAPGETVEAAIVFESNRNVTATLKMWVVDPEGRDTEAASSPVTLSSAEHTIVRESFSLTTEYAGMHSVVYGLYDASNQLLVSGAEAFDCGGAVVLAVGTEKSEYPLATEEVKTRIQLYGDGQVNLLLFINGEPVKTVGAELSGVTTQEITLEPSLLKPGQLTLRAEVQRDNLLSRKETHFTYGSALPDLMIGGLVSSRNIWAYTIQADVSNQGQTAAGPTAVSFFEGDPAQGGLLIAERPVVELAAGESAQVEIAWSGQAKSGAREIWAVVDQAHAVREFNEDNNTASLSLDIPSIVHELKLEKTAFSAFEDMTMITLIANNRETPVQGQWKLKIVSLAPLPDVWEAEGEIAAIAPYGQLLSSHVFNWGSNPEGEYRVSQIVTLDGSVFEDQVVVTVLRTEKISAAFTLDPAKISPNREESVNVELDLQNRGNVAIENGILSLEVLEKETGLKAAEKEWEFNLGITESRKETKILTLNLAEGFYTVKLLYKGEVLDEKELEAKIQIVYTKQESLAPRVLVLANPLSLIKGLLGDEERNKIFQERALIEEALRNAGIFYKLETNPLLQIRELRSGKYNLTILVDIGPILPQVTQEIKERAWNGEGVIAILSLGLWHEFTEELFGLKVQGVKKNQVETIRTYATAISQEGAFGLKSDFLNLKAVDPGLILVGTKESDQKPAIVLRTYGDGRAVAFGFNFTAAPGEPAYAALQNLLVESIRYLQPRQGNSGTITRLIPVELTFQNPTSSAVQLKVVEERPENVKIVAAEPEPGSLEPLTWAFTLEPSGLKYLTYTAELPDVAASYELKTNIVKIEAGRESPISTVSLTETVEKTIRETLLETITQFQQLPVSTASDRLAVRLAAANLTAILNRDESRPFGYHLNLRNVLAALGEIEKIRTAETGSVRKRLIELMLAYERKTVEAEWAMNIGLIIDLQKLF